MSSYTNFSKSLVKFIVVFCNSTLPNNKARNCADVQRNRHRLKKVAKEKDAIIQATAHSITGAKSPATILH